MSDFGGKLRQARERRGIPLRQIAANTRIPVLALEALEQNDISKLPGGIFSRAFVRSYAVEVGLDPEETVREFVERFRDEPPPTGGSGAGITEAALQFERQRHAAARAFVAAVVVMLIASAAVLYFVLRGRPDELLLTEPAQSGAVAATAPTRSHVPDTGATADTPAPAAALGESAPDAAPASATFRLDLHPKGPCWVSAIVDGSRIIGRTMHAGESETLEVREQAVITVGDAGAFAFSIDGRAARSVGSPGEVATLRLSRSTLDQYLR